MKSRRIALLRDHMRRQGLDAFVVSSLFNIRFLTGFTGSYGLCVVGRKDLFFVTDSRYSLQAREEVRGCRPIITTRGLYEALDAHRLLRGCRTVGFEADVVTYAQYRVMRRGRIGESFIPLRDVVESIALVKEKKELECIREAVRISDHTFDEILPSIRPGVTELEVAAEISYCHKKLGAQGDAFDPIVASGERGAFPHARASAKKIKNREMVVLDFGCTFGGYHSDITRTLAIGSVPPKARRIYQTVLDAQLEAIGAARGGMIARDLDAVARGRIAKEGYGEYFTHSLGHGLGMRLHERPRVSSLSKEPLNGGMVITIEPGVYLPGFGGVRIEDDVLLTSGGCEVLNRAPKQFMIV